MKIEKILDEKDHKLFLFITNTRLYIREWIGQKDEEFEYGVLRVTYIRCPEDTDMIYLKGFPQ